MGNASPLPHTPVDEVAVLRAENSELRQQLQAVEAARRQQEERFRDLAETIREVFWICDPDLTKMLYISPGYEEIWGRSCQSLYDDPMSFIAAIHPDDRDRAMALINCRSWEGYCQEYRIVRPDGDIRWIRDRAWPVRDQAGNVIRVAGIAEDLSLLKSGEEAIRKYEQLVSMANVRLAFLDREYCYKTVSRGYAEAFEQNQEWMMGKSMVQVIGQDDFQKIKPYLDRCLLGEAVSHEYWMNRPGSNSRYFLAHYHPYFEADGSISGIVVVIHDLTKRKQAEELFKESEEKFRTLAQAVPDIIFMNQTDGSCEFVNHRLYEYTGLPSGSGLGLGWKQALHPDDVERTQALWSTAVRHGQAYEDRYRFMTPNDTYRWFMARAIPVKNKDGQIDKYVGVSTDIQNLMEDEESLKESEERFRLLSEAIPQQVWTARPDGTLDYVNQRVVEYFGCPGEELVDQGWQTVIHPDDLPECLERWANARSTYKPYEVEFRLRRGRDQAFRWHLGRALPIFNHEGQVVKWFGTNTDLTDFKDMEEKVRQAQKMEAIGTLAGGIAHDFNNILMAMMGYAELAQLNAHGYEKVQRNLREVVHAGQRAKELVQQILTFSRQTEQTKQPLDLQVVVKEALKFLRATLPSNIEIRSQFTDESTILIGDAIQMHQVVLNLCTNAEYAMRGQGGVLTVKVARVMGAVDGEESLLGQNREARICLTVRDTGMGIAPDVLRRIFDPFFTTKGVGQGTGMGLAVVHGIVNSHEGSISVESTPGKGTLLSISFPAVNHVLPLDQDPPFYQERLQRQWRILFVEDEMLIAQFGKEALERLGYEVVVRTSSVEALEAFRADPFRFDAVITDQTMPNLTGDVLARALLEIRPDVPIILCTGFSHVITPEKAKALGIRAFLMKPLLMKDLGKVLREVLFSPSSNRSKSNE